VENII